MKPTAIGATANPWRLAKNPMVPKIRTIQTSIKAELREYEPTTAKANTMGQRMEIGTREILAKSFAA